MRKLIIEIRDGIDDAEALEKVLAVVKGGKVSGGYKKNRKQYCYLTEFQDHTTVYCPVRYKQKSEKFNVS